MMTLLLNPPKEVGFISPDDLQFGGVTSSGEGGVSDRGARNETVDMLNHKRPKICADSPSAQVTHGFDN